MVVIKYARSYEDALKKINRATKKAVKRFEKDGRHIKPNSKHAKIIKKKLKEYWENNIYKTFNARDSSGLLNSGQLGKSLVIQFRKNEIAWYMKRIGHPEDGGISGGKCYDYGRLLRQNKTNFSQMAAAGTEKPSRYYPEWDCKVRSAKGQNELRYKDYWGKWEIIWDKTFVDTCDYYFSEYFAELIDEELRKSL